MGIAVRLALAEQARPANNAVGERGIFPKHLNRRRTRRREACRHTSGPMALTEKSSVRGLGRARGNQARRLGARSTGQNATPAFVVNFEWYDLHCRWLDSLIIRSIERTPSNSSMRIRDGHIATIACEELWPFAAQVLRRRTLLLSAWRKDLSGGWRSVVFAA